MKKTWHGKLTLDLRDEALEKGTPEIDVIDDRKTIVMKIMPDEHGRYDHAGDIVDLLNVHSQ